MKNLDIRNYAKGKRVLLWQISEELGLSHESAFSRMLRHELSDKKKEQIKEIIDRIAQEQESN